VVAYSVLSKIEASMEEAEAYYNANVDKFKRDDQVRARQILVREEKEAVAARDRILGGEDFASVAIDISLSPDSQDGGDLGYFSRGVMPPEFDEVVFAMHTAVVSDVVPSPYGYHLFLIQDKKDARDLSFNDVKDEILKRIEREKMEEIYMTWIEDLKNRSKIEINRDALKRGIKVR
jgi:peptidyl-prolyl cis-trans isomerase C